MEDSEEDESEEEKSMRDRVTLRAVDLRLLQKASAARRPAAAESRTFIYFSDVFVLKIVSKRIVDMMSILMSW